MECQKFLLEFLVISYTFSTLSIIRMLESAENVTDNQQAFQVEMIVFNDLNDSWEDQGIFDCTVRKQATNIQDA